MILKIANKPYELATKEEVMKEVNKVMEETKKEILDNLYPVGSVYISLSKTFNPNNIFNGKWQLIKDGIFLEATQDINQVGKEIEAGLPNIKGKIDGSKNSHTEEVFGDLNMDATIVTPPFYLIAGTQAGTLDSGSFRSCRGFGMDFSTSHRIWRNDVDTVQPNSIRCFMWQRIS